MARPGVVITVYNEARAGWRERPARKCPKCGYEAFEDGWPEDWRCPKCSVSWYDSGKNEGRKEWQYEDKLSERYEGNELLATLDSVRANSEPGVPIVVVDDGSDDGCCARAGEFGATVVRHEKRIGIGYSRTEGVEHLDPACDTVMFLDAHMRISAGCIEHSAGLALERDAIIWPDVRGLRDRPRFKKRRRGRLQETATQHGAAPRVGPDKDEPGYLFRNRLIFGKPKDTVSRTHALNSPGYTLPRSVWDIMPISKLTRGFGGNEPMLWVKAFFLDVPILHTCGAMVRHIFREHTAHYTATSREVMRNMAILAKTCFDAETWNGFWWPEVFEAAADKEMRAVLGSDELWEEHLSFQSRKKRPDCEFWRGLCLEPIPGHGDAAMSADKVAKGVKHRKLAASGRLVSQAEKRAGRLAKRNQLRTDGRFGNAGDDRARKVAKRAALKAKGLLKA